MEIESSDEAFATQVHPVVIAHPNTGRPALYVNSVYTQRLDDVDPMRTQDLLGRLVQHSTHPNLTCRLRWANGMLAIWDNRAVQHLAINDYAGQRRELFRTSVKGDAARRVRATDARPLQRTHAAPDPIGGEGGAHRGPEFGAQPVGVGSDQPVRRHHPFDHVGEHRRERAAVDTHRHDRAR